MFGVGFLAGVAGVIFLALISTAGIFPDFLAGWGRSICICPSQFRGRDCS